MKNEYKQLITSLVFFICIGVGYYAWQQEWFILNYPCHATYKNKNDQLTNKQVYVWYVTEEQLHKENTEIIWSSIRPTENAHRLAQRVLTLLYENQIFKKKCTVRMALSDYTGQELLLFFDRSPLTNSLPVRIKLLIIESILKTIRENGISFTAVRFFVNNEPLQDTHLDFNQPWPLTKFNQNT